LGPQRHGEGREGLRAYVEKELPHLLRAYDAEFLVDALARARAPQAILNGHLRSAAPPGRRVRIGPSSEMFTRSSVVAPMDACVPCAPECFPPRREASHRPRTFPRRRPDFRKIDRSQEDSEPVGRSMRRGLAMDAINGQDGAAGQAQGDKSVKPSKVMFRTSVALSAVAASAAMFAAPAFAAWEPSKPVEFVVPPAPAAAPTRWPA
jgi:hypothetical protein